MLTGKDMSNFALENSREWIGIDISPTACRVMAKRLRDVCGLPESEPLWRAGRGFVVRDLPWTVEKLRVIPPFEFENWAVIALGGIPNKVQVGDMGVDGRIFPVSSSAAPRKQQEGELGLKERWYPIQVKQKDKAGRPDIDAFEAMMMREDCEKGFFVSFVKGSVNDNVLFLPGMMGPQLADNLFFLGAWSRI